MTTLRNTKSGILRTERGYTLEFTESNGYSTYFVVDQNGDVWEMTDTLKKANNRFNKIMKCFVD